MRRAVVAIAIGLLPLFLQAATDPVQAKLDAMYRAQLHEADDHVEYAVYDRWPGHEPRTIFATIDPDIDRAVLIVFRVSRQGELKRLARYDDDVRSVAVRDVTGDGKPEVLITHSPGNRSAGVEILQWDGHDLSSIGETNDSAIEVDLDHDGIPEFVESGGGERNECDTVLRTPYLFKFRNGKLVSEKRPRLAEVVVATKQTSKRETTTHIVALPDNFSKSCVLRVVNGTAHGRHRAGGMELAVRTMQEPEVKAKPGRKVPVSVTGDTEYLDLPIVLPSRCTLLDVTLTGPAGATVAFVIETTSVRK